jgi:hypothetical protein
MHGGLHPWIKKGCLMGKKLKFVRIGTRPGLYLNMFKRGPQINEESM